jgi:hypothetical protein
MLDLFGRSAAPSRAQESKALGCYQTPTWAAEALVERYFADLDSSDTVVEPSCGEGHFLEVIPREVTAVGIELDPVRAAIARERTGREIIVGDVGDVELSVSPTVLIGNPPFQSELVDRLLERAHIWLPDGGRCGFLLPAFILSKQTRVMEWSDRWAITSELVPRDLFPGPRLPIVFARFEKSRRRTLVGFSLFPEAAAIRQLPARIRHLLTHGRAPAWKTVVFDAMRDYGGEATLEQLYRVIEGRRPTTNPHWRAKVRQVVHCYARRTGPATYALPLEPAA